MTEMMQRACLAFALALAVGVCPGSPAAQQRSPCTSYRVRVNVIDKDGYAIAGLRAEDFQGRFRGKPVKIVSVRTDTRAARIVIVLDASGSMRGRKESGYGRWKLASGIAAHATLTLAPRNRVALLMFSEKTFIVGFAEGQQAILRELQSIQADSAIETRVRGGTTLYSAIVEAAQVLTPPEAGDAMLIITDGLDNLSSERADQMASLLIDSGVRMFVTLFPEAPGTVGAGSRGLKRTIRQFQGIAAMTGGWVLRVNSKKGGQEPTFQLGSEADAEPAEQLSRLYAAMTEAYEIVVELPQAVDKPREWQLELVPRPGLKPQDYQLAFPRKLLPCQAGSDTK